MFPFVFTRDARTTTSGHSCIRLPPGPEALAGQGARAAEVNAARARIPRPTRRFPTRAPAGFPAEVTGADPLDLAGPVDAEGAAAHPFHSQPVLVADDRFTSR